MGVRLCDFERSYGARPAVLAAGKHSLSVHPDRPCYWHFQPLKRLFSLYFALFEEIYRDLERSDLKLDGATLAVY